MEDDKTLQDLSVHLTKDLLCQILRSISGNDHVELTGCKFDEGFGKGDSFLGVVRRIVVEGRDQDQRYTSSLIVKGFPPGIARRKTFKSVVFFRNEAAFYDEVMTHFLKFQEGKSLENPFTSIPKCYKTVIDGENDLLVLEDLSVDGYCVASRIEGVDYAHCELALKEFGRFHALSLAMKDQDPDQFKKISESVEETYYHPGNRGWYENFLKEKLCVVALDAVNKVYPKSVYVERMKKFSEKLYDRLIEMVRPKEPLAVIGHGDSWCPNFLFRYHDTSGERTPESARIIDFQLARYGSPALDLTFFIYSCTSKQMRDQHLKQLLHAYHDSLTSFLQDLGSSPQLFTFQMLQEEFDKYRTYGLGFGLESIYFSSCDPDTLPDLSTMEGEEEIPLIQCWTVKPITSKASQQRLVDVICDVLDSDNF